MSKTCANPKVTSQLFMTADLKTVSVSESCCAVISEGRKNLEIIVRF
ncbi:hypothetical protein B4121_4600 [Bacillus paralicheniformis]|uniref:Uncharacterized protein n=1 Tax=Bacillus paralicheniformis TaxID=1648923 RepID=A0A7Z0WUB9_9BACI|nr:hypothetical protein B4121_4600 [Bacillus paralicheniformis]